VPKSLKPYVRWFNWGALVGVLATVFIARVLMIATLNEHALGARLVHASYDLPFGFRKPRRATEAVIVYMDEDSHRELQQSAQQAWDRRLHAQLIRKLIVEQAKVIVFDSTFLRPGDPTADAELAAAMKAHGKVVVGSMLETEIEPNGNIRTSHLDSKPFLQAARSGVVNLEPDSKLFVRRAFRIPPDSGIDEVPLPDKAAEIAGYAVSEESRNADWLNYYGPPGYLRWTSYHYALKTGTPPGFFRDKVVFVGSNIGMGFALEKRDEYETPYSLWGGKTIPGVEIHATRFLNLIHGDGLRRLSPGTEDFLIAVFGIALGWGLLLVRPVVAVALALLAAAGIAGASFVVFKADYWWAWVISAGVQVPVALSWAVVYNTIRLKIESKTLQRSLALHLSPKRAKQISKRPELLRLGAEKQEISILFSDIANFSTITARMHPEDLFKLLNKYFETALACVHQTDGTVVKLIGDAIFAIWNAPFPQENHARSAVEAALRMRDQLIQFDAAQQSLPLQTRIGLHTGEAFVGNVGSQERFDYTAIGDAINLASRLEGLNKYLGTKILATRDIQRLVDQEFSSRLVGHFIFKGIERPVEVHEILGRSETAAWKSIFAEALFNFQRRNFEAATRGFHKSIEARGGDDGPSQFYLTHLEKLAPAELSESWAGEVRLTEK
jgi:adenylate cyclase